MHANLLSQRSTAQISVLLVFSDSSLTIKADCLWCRSMDLYSARSLMISSNNNTVVDVMITLFREESKEFALRSRYFSHNVSNPPMPPVLRCRMHRGGGRCRGVVSQLALTQMCTFHQVRRTGDLNLDGLRCLSTAHPSLFRLVVGRNNPDWATS